MRTLVTVLLLLIALGAQPLRAADYRFQALIDLDGDLASGCAVTSGATTLGGSELRAFARSDRAKVLEVVLQSCRDGQWHDELRSVQALPIAVGQGDAGSDRVRWSLPSSQLPAVPSLGVRLLSERLDVSAQDVIDDGTAARVLRLNLGDAARPLPALGGLGLLLAALALIWLGGRHVRAGGRNAPLIIALPLVLALAQWTPAISRVNADMPQSVVASDAGNDSRDAGSDIVRGQIAVVGQTLEFQFDVNNIEDNGLEDNAKVLFIGNSLTYANDLPLMLQAIAAQAGKALVVKAITMPGAALEDHFVQHTAHVALANGGYQWVIMQQGPSSVPANQEHLRTWASRFNPLIRAGGARPAMYMVWPDAGRLAYFDDVRDAYSNAALAINGMFIPAGEAWREAWRSDPALALYGPDQFHPSALGSYVAGLSMFAELYQQSPLGLPAELRLSTGQTMTFDAEEARTVQSAAWRTHLALGRRGE